MTPDERLFKAIETLKGKELRDLVACTTLGRHEHDICGRAALVASSYRNNGISRRWMEAGNIVVLESRWDYFVTDSDYTSDNCELVFKPIGWPFWKSSESRLQRAIKRVQLRKEQN